MPYDSGLVAVRDVAAHRAAMSLTAEYLPPAPGSARDNYDWVPEASRRARAVPIYAALRSLGTGGVAEVIDRCCRLAAGIADGLAQDPDVRILNDVVLNQVLVRVGDDDARTADVVRRVQLDGTAWLGPTRWRDQGAFRLSVSNWSTTESDAQRTVSSILRAVRETAGPRAGR